MQSLLIVGTGGHAKTVLDCARQQGYTNIAFLTKEAETTFCGCPCFQDDGIMLQRLRASYAACFVAIGDNYKRESICMEASSLGYMFPVIIHPMACVSPSAEIGEGTLIAPMAVVNADAIIGRFCILNTASVLEHGCRIGDAVHLSPRAAVCGGVKISNHAWICAGAVVSNGVSIGANSIIAAGAAVVSDIPSNVMAAGVPSVIKKHIAPALAGKSNQWEEPK